MCQIVEDKSKKQTHEMLYIMKAGFLHACFTQEVLGRIPYPDCSTKE